MLNTLLVSLMNELGVKLVINDPSFSMATIKEGKTIYEAK
jgi:hypothetical protein